MEIIKKIGYPKNGNLAFRPCLYLYNLVRTKKPSIVLETGVSKGFSSRIILEALQRNGKGKLISTEISDNVGNLVTPHLKKRWFLVVDKNGNALSIAMKKVRTIDIFMHDSSHTHDNMLKDFTSALKKIKSNGLILSDDVESNSAFVEFAKSLNKNPIYIPNIIKCFGIINMCT
ncbi:MAG: class I SAM-dependent methyltransferase [Candidatus Marsarchaeota archaeon]|nr:class I SAM-dependent methyltransferase [Candidatus Marsarchaeota archaeon]MCL5111264.1 class I SAM-dependent methyltransferase [Candidatus Marsarchaeota archaeon]